jgi:hypothetical protein
METITGHDIFAGEAIRHDRSISAENFNIFHDTMLESSVEFTKSLLARRVVRTATNYINYVSDKGRSDDAELIPITFQHVLSSIAQEHFDVFLGERKYIANGLGWVDYSRASINAALQNASSEENFAQKALFFYRDGQFLRRLGKGALAVAHPWGMYKRYAFVSGVSQDLIETRPHMANKSNS